MTDRNPLPKTTAALNRGIEAGLHRGAQVFVARLGESISTAADFALGEARPGMAMTPDTVMLWLSSSKPVMAVALAQLAPVTAPYGLSLGDRVPDATTIWLFDVPSSSALRDLLAAPLPAIGSITF